MDDQYVILDKMDNIIIIHISLIFYIPFFYLLNMILYHLMIFYNVLMYMLDESINNNYYLY